LLRWAAKNGRHHLPWRLPSAKVYQKILAETLLQRTRAESVAGFLDSFLKAFPSWQAIAGASQDQLELALKPLGLWRRRAISLKSLSTELVLRNGRFPARRAEIEALPGVGQYIANAILSICHRDVQPLLDVNMARVLERYFGPRKLADIRYDPYLQQLAVAVIEGKSPMAVNWAILDLAAALCIASVPRCSACPLSPRCRYVALGKARPRRPTRLRKRSSSERMA
jgi:A/G-specific adenine glycosylase